MPSPSNASYLIIARFVFLFLNIISISEVSKKTIISICYCSITAFPFYFMGRNFFPLFLLQEKVLLPLLAQKTLLTICDTPTHSHSLTYRPLGGSTKIVSLKQDHNGEEISFLRIPQGAYQLSIY